MNIRALLAVLLVLTAGISMAQEGSTDPFADSQAELSNKISAEWQAMWDDCNALVKKPITTDGDASSYINCFFGNFPRYFRSWASMSRDTLSGARGIIEKYVDQYMPSGENTAAERQSLTAIAVHLHQKLTAWHQRVADQTNALGAISFLAKSEVEGVLEVLQRSYKTCTAVAKSFVDELKSEKTFSQEELKSKYSDYLDSILNPPTEVIDKQLATILNAVVRSERQYETYMQRSKIDPKSYVEGYDEYLSNILKALNTCATNLWTMKQQPQEQETPES